MYKRNKILLVHITADPKRLKTFIPHLVDFDLRAVMRGWASGPKALVIYSWIKGHSPNLRLTKPPDYNLVELNGMLMT